MSIVAIGLIIARDAIINETSSGLMDAAKANGIKPCYYLRHEIASLPAALKPNGSRRCLLSVCLCEGEAVLLTMTDERCG